LYDQHHVVKKCGLVVKGFCLVEFQERFDGEGSRLALGAAAGAGGVETVANVEDDAEELSEADGV